MSGYASEWQDMDESYMRKYKMVGEHNYLKSMGTAPMKKSDPFRHGRYSPSKTKLQVERFELHRLRVQRYGHGCRRDLPFPFKFLQFIRMGEENGLLNGLRYEIMTKGEEPHTIEGDDRIGTVTDM